MINSTTKHSASVTNVDNNMTNMIPKQKLPSQNELFAVIIPDYSIGLKVILSKHMTTQLEQLLRVDPFLSPAQQCQSTDSSSKHNANHRNHALYFTLSRDKVLNFSAASKGSLNGNSEITNSRVNYNNISSSSK